MNATLTVSAAALGEYLGPSAPLPGDGVHLPECPHRGGSPTEPCDWCQWAIQTPELETLLAVGRDTRALLGWGSLDSVAAVVAFARLDVAMAPEHQFLKDEETEDTGQHDGAGGGGIAAGDDRLRQHFQERSAEQRTNGITDQHRHPGSAGIEGECRRRQDRERATDKG